MVVVVDIVIPSGGGVPTALLRRPRSLPGGVLRSFAAPDVVVDEEGARAVCGRPVCPRQGGAGVDAGDVDVEIRLEEGRKSGDLLRPVGSYLPDTGHGRLGDEVPRPQGLEIRRERRSPRAWRRPSG